MAPKVFFCYVCDMSANDSRNLSGDKFIYNEQI
jgi:hypothetical protein